MAHILKLEFPHIIYRKKNYHCHCISSM